MSQLARHPEKTADQITEEFLSAALGQEALPEAASWAEAMEEVWTRLYASSQHAAGFNWPWNMVFAGGLLPPSLMGEPIPPELAEDIDEAIAAARTALDAIRNGDLPGAVEAFGGMTRLAQLMVPRSLHAVVTMPH